MAQQPLSGQIESSDPFQSRRCSANGSSQHCRHSFLTARRPRPQLRRAAASESAHLTCFSSGSPAGAKRLQAQLQQSHLAGAQPHSNRRACSLCPQAASTSRAPSRFDAQKVTSKDGKAATFGSHQQHTRRLEILIALRKMYRNLLRAQGLLAQPSPIYSSDVYGPGKRQALASADLDEEEKDKRDAAVEIVAELQLTAEQLKADLRSLYTFYGSFGDVFDDSPAEKEEQIAKIVAEISASSAERAAKEIKLLPYRTVREAQAALDARNARYKTAARSAQRKGDAAEADPRELSERLGAAEKAVEKFVAKRIQPAVQKAVKTPVRRWAAGFRTGADYVTGVWVRLNGGGRRADGLVEGLPEGLQMPRANKEARAAATKALSVEISSLEKRLQDSSKAREQRLRKAGMSERPRMAGQLRDMDDEVLILSRTLAVKTLQLELEYIFAALEDEALDVAQGTKDAGFLLSRTGSSDEVALLIAEFGLLESQLGMLLEAIEAGHTALLDDDNLAHLAVDIPDLRSRLGIGEATVFSGSGWTFVRWQAAIGEALGKVKDGVMFFSRGIRLLISDVSSAGQLFSRAVLGASLKGREVQALRRTARDVLTFIPFAIVLIAPITPIGHVLVFSFMQRYFPGFFPSQFTTRRQELMSRYEELKRQLEAAQEAAQQEDEEAELARATAAVARLTAPSAAVAEADIDAAKQFAVAASRNGRKPPSRKTYSAADEAVVEGPAAKALRNLEEQVAAAAEQTLRDVDEEQ